jgi:predicted rRNA methylase YqxC with S4 and FtsJ domains
VRSISAALNAWGIAVRDKVILDAGCSTADSPTRFCRTALPGSYAVDVGYIK